MNISHETLAPLVGKTVTVTRNDVPGSWTGVLDNVWGDGVLRIIYISGFKEVVPLDRVASVFPTGPEGSYGPDYIPPGTPVPLCSSCGERHFSLAGCQGPVGPPGVHNDPTPSRYQWSYKGVEFDFYRLCEILGIKHHAQAHALKKVIRAGRSVKSLETDIDEAVACLVRWKEMILEDQA